MSSLVRTILLCLAVLAAAPLTAADKPPRFAALLAGGQRVQGNRLTDWHDKAAQPKLEGQPLAEASNPFRWLRDRSLSLPDLPAAYIELHSGDRFPGLAIDYRSGHERPFEPLPPHLVVRSAQRFEPPENKPVAEIRVALSFVRKIVWQRRGRQAYQPGTAIYRDGRQLAFRAIRFGSGELNLLLPEGDSRRVPWSDLAEVHLPAADPWAAHWDEVAVVCPNIDSRLYQVETTAGLVATASQARVVPRFEGNSADCDRWVHGLQPAWSLDILWVPCREMVFRRGYAPREVPLSRLSPRAPRQAAAADDDDAPLPRAEINRNTHGGPLRSHTLEFGWGLGVHGASQLAFDLPAGVRSLRTQVCLDRAAGRGGCLRAKIWTGQSAGNPLWQSPLLIGSETVADSGVLALAGPPSQTQLVLEIDPADNDRPAGADPLDIRDHADWCDPLLELDPAAVRAQFDKRLARRFYAWREWSATIPPGGGVEIAALRDAQLPAPGAFHAAVAATGKPLVLKRQITVGPRDQWLVIAATRPEYGGQEPKLVVRIGGELAAELPVPVRQSDAGENRPLAVALAGYQRTPPATIDVEIRQLPADKTPVEYRTIETADQLPTLYRVFEEQAALAALDPPTGGSAAVTADDRYHGSRAIRVGPGGQFRLPLGQTIRIRERPAWGEYRFIRFAVKKPGGGRVAIGFESADARQSLPRYDLGKGSASFGAATRIWQDNPPKDWVVMTRDLFADFGPLDLTALLLGATEGQPALVDHIYLARGHRDFESIPAAPSPEATNDKVREQLVSPLIDRARPATVRLDMPDGRQGLGVIIHPEGEILTAGHLAYKSGALVRVTLAGGTVVSARIRGLDREFDLALLQVEPRGNFAKLEKIGTNTPRQDQVYLAMTPAGPPDEFMPAAGEPVALRRVLPATIWTDLDVPHWLPGGPLLDRDGNLLAVQVAISRFGGVTCARLLPAWEHFQPMRSGQQLGTWLPGSEPVLGIDGEAAVGGLALTAIAPDSPAARAGLLPDDLLHKLDGQPVANLDDLQQLLAQRDPEREVTLDLSRAAAPLQVKVRLAPRVP
ncbi:MAG: PDZ domain-containing protein [Pirellulaceae bacterium]|nr:PDZ domain-containing protein [Pirellulaceae bacterium]